ncbi:hypothetical protein FQN60_014263, partial [Etheostoma spectabile]
EARRLQAPASPEPTTPRPQPGPREQEQGQERGQVQLAGQIIPVYGFGILLYILYILLRSHLRATTSQPRAGFLQFGQRTRRERSLTLSWPSCRQTEGNRDGDGEDCFQRPPQSWQGEGVTADRRRSPAAADGDHPGDAGGPAGGQHGTREEDPGGLGRCSTERCMLTVAILTCNEERFLCKYLKSPPQRIMGDV